MLHLREMFSTRLYEDGILIDRQDIWARFTDFICSVYWGNTLMMPSLFFLFHGFYVAEAFVGISIGWHMASTFELDAGTFFLNWEPLYAFNPVNTTCQPMVMAIRLLHGFPVQRKNRGMEAFGMPLVVLGLLISLYSYPLHHLTVCHRPKGGVGPWKKCMGPTPF